MELREFRELHRKKEKPINYDKAFVDPLLLKSYGGR
jgi:hypothetical protein